MMARSEFRVPASGLIPWLQLLRLPNLLTVPGDPLIGYWLAGGESSDKFPMVLIASLLFYAGGLITNDLVDVRIDLRERPARPLPSGRIKKKQAVLVAMLFFGIAELLCWWIGSKTGWMGNALLFSILSYNLFAKKNKTIGPLNMGLCRGLNVLLGASIINFTVHAQAAAIVITWFIVCVTWMARNEAIQKKKPHTIGLLLSMLIPLQAVFMAMAGHAWMACLWLALWPIHRLCAKIFYAS